MTIIPTFKMKQPHIEQAHRHLEDATSEIGKAQAHAEILDDERLSQTLKEIEYLLQSMRDVLPPKQMKLPLGK